MGSFLVTVEILEKSILSIALTMTADFSNKILRLENCASFQISVPGFFVSGSSLSGSLSYLIVFLSMNNLLFLTFFSKFV